MMLHKESDGVGRQHSLADVFDGLGDVVHACEMHMQAASG